MTNNPLLYGSVISAKVPVVSGGRTSFQSVKATPYVSISGRFGLSYRLPGRGYQITSVSSHELGYANSLRAGRFFVDAGQCPSIRLGSADIGTAELIAQTIRAELDGAGLSDGLQKQLRIDLGASDSAIGIAMAAVMAEEVTIKAWCQMWDGLARHDPSRLEALASEYLEECDRLDVDADADTIRRGSVVNIGSVRYVVLRGISKAQLDLHRERLASLDQKLGLTIE